MSRPDGSEKMRSGMFRSLVMLIVSTSVAGCSGGKPPFRQIQLCLADANEIPAFTGFMNELAQKYRMEFHDRSGQTQDELQSLASDQKGVPLNDHAVNISADRDSEVNFGASNLGLPTEQIGIGFNGNNLADAKPIADAIVQALSARWHVHEVPKERGAAPLVHCD